MKFVGQNLKSLAGLFIFDFIHHFLQCVHLFAKILKVKFTFIRYVLPSTKLYMLHHLQMNKLDETGRIDNNVIDNRRHGKFM